MAALNIIKLSVGTDSVETLRAWQDGRVALAQRRLGKPLLWHTTRMVPKRQAELLEGGSIYWVIKGVVQARQRIIGFDDGHKEDGTPCCLVMLDRKLVMVRPTPKRPFQGWRYLPGEEAPPDLGADASDGLAAMPPALRRELAELGLL